MAPLVYLHSAPLEKSCKGAQARERKRVVFRFVNNIKHELLCQISKSYNRDI